MGQLVAAVAVIAALLLVVAVLVNRFENWERPWIWSSLMAHFGAGIAQVLIVTQVYGGGDMTAYQRAGNLLARFLVEYPIEGSSMLVQVIFQQPDVPLPVLLKPGPTGAMQAISGFVMLLLDGSLYSACLLFGGLTFLAGLVVYRVFKLELSREHHFAALIGCLWVPSVVFWSSAMLKEPVAITGLGLSTYGGYSLATGRRFVSGLLLFVLGLATTALVKPYLLVPFGLAAGMWLYLDGPRPAHRRRLRQVRLGPFIIGVLLAVGFVVGIGRLFPRFDVASLAEETANMQASLQWTAGGSDYSIGNPEDRTFVGQLAFAPLAVLTALFRPTLLDIQNPLIAVNALETTAIMVLLIMGLARSGAGAFFRTILGSPILGFSAVYVVVLALGVGLGTTNLGTLSRYRVPMMPFFVTLVGVMAVRRQRSPVSSAPRLGPSSHHVSQAKSVRPNSSASSLL